MKQVNNSLEQTDFTVVVTVNNAEVKSVMYTSVEPLTAFRDFPIWPKSIKYKKENWMEEFRYVTQFIYKHLGEPDDKSFAHQIGVVKTHKSANGKLIKKYPEHTVEEFIMAQVLSKVHDSISGKMEGVSFSYASNDLNFKAKWAYGKNKFVVINDVS